MNKRVNTSFLTSATCGVAMLSISDFGPGESWMLIMPAGEVKTRDGRGPYFVGDQAAMQAVINRTLTHYGDTEPMVDFDHHSTLRNQGVTAKAAGWIKELEARDTGIWARIDWTAAAAEMIKAKEYQYLSPYFTHSKQGDVGIILNVALTNMPALDLHAVAASIDLNSKGTEMDKIAEALGLKTDASEDVILAALASLTAMRGNLVTALGMKDDATAEDIEAALGFLPAPADLASALGVKMDASAKDVLAAATALSATGDPDPAEYVPMAMFTETRDQLSALTAEMNAGKATAAVDQAIADGKLTPAQRDWGVSLFSSDQSAFEAFVGTAPKLTQSQRTTRRQEDDRTALSIEEQEAATALGLDHNEYLKTLQAEQKQEN